MMDQQLIEDIMETYSTSNVLFSIKIGSLKFVPLHVHISKL
jgi:hypothetical protein